MAQGRDSRTGYEWEEHPVPSEPEPLTMPERAGEEPRGAADRVGPAALGSNAPEPSTPEPNAPEPGGGRRGALPAWAIVAIVLVQATALVATVALVMGGLQRLGHSPEPVATTTVQATAPDQSASPEREPGTVTDQSGREISDGTGGFEQPAAPGEHTLSWSTWTDGTISVTALEVDLDATAPAAQEETLLQDGYRLVLATYEVRYDGPGQLAPAEELWLTGESERSYFPDIGEGLVPDPMKAISPLESGRSATFRSAFLVPETEIESFRLGVETYTGEILYVGT